jgi:hypothetical protein
MSVGLASLHMFYIVINLPDIYQGISLLRNRDISVGIETGYGLDSRCSIHARGKKFSFFHSVQTDSDFMF